jgi:ArsR family transcriptional regulator
MTKNEKNKHIQDTVQLFKIYSDYTRLRIIDFLMNGEYCVQEITAELEATQSAISHQLRLLRDLNVVKSRKQGKNSYYSLVDNHIKDIFLTACEHVTNCKHK